MRYMVTGANGFVGRHLTHMLLEQGHTVHALVRGQVSHSGIRHAQYVPFTGDICHPQSILPAVAGCDGIFHTAAYAKPWAKDASLYHRVNVEGTQHVLDAAVQAGIQKVVCTSSAGIFGISNGTPVNESSVRTAPYYNAYERSKAAADQLAFTYAASGPEVVIVAPTRIFGPAPIHTLQAVNIMIFQYLFNGWRFIPGKGSQIANYIYVTDVTAGLMAAMQHGKNGEYYILGGDNYSIQSFFEILSRVSGIHKRMIHIPEWMMRVIARIELYKPYWGGTPTFTPDWLHKAISNWETDTGKARRALHLSPMDLQSGLTLTVDNFRQQYAAASDARVKHT